MILLILSNPLIAVSIWNLKGSVTSIVITQLYCPLLKPMNLFPYQSNLRPLGSANTPQDLVCVNVGRDY